MSVLCWSLEILSIAFLLHLLIWKIHLPKHQTKALLLIFFGMLVSGLLGLWGMKALLPLRMIPTRFPEYLHIALFVTSFTLAYVITYSAIEADSPSLVMMLAIASAGPEGLPKARFEQLMTDDLLVLPRIRDLVRDGMLVMVDGTYRLTPKGKGFVRIFVVYRQILGIAEKGG